jgi:hypothetical protein
MQQASPCTILSSVACLVLPHPSTLSLNGATFGRKDLLNTKCVLFLAINLSEIFVILRKIKVNMIINVH